MAQKNKQISVQSSGCFRSAYKLRVWLKQDMKQLSKLVQQDWAANYWTFFKDVGRILIYFCLLEQFVMFDVFSGSLLFQTTCPPVFFCSLEGFIFLPHQVVYAQQCNINFFSDWLYKKDIFLHRVVSICRYNDCSKQSTLQVTQAIQTLLSSTANTKVIKPPI